MARSAGVIFSLLLFAFILPAMHTAAMPANPNPIILTQPDGHPFYARQVGDERQSHFELLDGSPIEQELSGYWVYRGTNYRVGITMQPDAPPAGSKSASTAKPIQYLGVIPTPRYPSGHPLYGLKLWWESVQEKLTFDKSKLLLLRQEHLQNRIDELKFDIIYKDGKHAEELLQKIQTKRIEIDDTLDTLTGAEKADVVYGSVNLKVCKYPDETKCSVGGDAKEIDVILSDLKRQNTEVLSNLLNDSRMPESSRKGLENALNNSGMMKQIRANMVQGTYQATSSALRMLPFSAAWLYEPTEHKWYSIIVYSDKITITDTIVSIRDYDLYPTKEQVEEITQLAAKINRQGKITTKDKITLTKLWFTIKKTEAN